MPYDDADAGGGDASRSLSKPGRAPRRRFEDPHRPHRPPTAFVAFSNELRPQVISEHPEHSRSVKEIARILGERWKKLTEDDRERYRKEYVDKKKAYDQALREYFTANPDAQEREDALKRQKKHETTAKRARGPSTTQGPKKALTAFFAFSKEKRADTKASLGAGAKPTEITKRLAALWTSMTPVEKRPFEDMAAADRVRYQKQCEEAGYVPLAAKRARTVAKPVVVAPPPPPPPAEAEDEPVDEEEEEVEGEEDAEEEE
eukprot:TRINITY_DN178_c0_g1_i2.p1 TRINITY_DN178_c0_g1~~TRINITY_DN178_c0_g1_i2.p1  ORF type:complete len:260 (+),score=60.94 TRINITY_DN178_c0_g1_i2:138-917(+)